MWNTRWSRAVAAGGAAMLLAVSVAVSGAPAAADVGPAQSPGYTALGDSFTSGVGTREYDGDSGDCLRSPHAYPVLGAGRVGADLTFVACSGATIAGVLNNQVGALDSSADYVTIQVGGNDAGFADVITQCALPWPWTCWNEIDEANRFIQEDLPGRLDQVYSAISDRAPNAAVLVVGYPRLFNGQECNALARISPGEQAELNATADRLAQVIGARASVHGFGYVDPRAEFVGHAVCDSVEWINGLSNPVRESYHPNVAGQRDGYTALVTAALGSPVPAPVALVGQAELPALDLDFSRAELFTDGSAASTVTDAEMRIVYDHLTNRTAPCLVDAGYEPGEAPGWKTFADTYGTADGWNPFEGADSETVRACTALDEFALAR